MKVKSESEVAHLGLTLHDPMDCSLPGSSVYGIFQARVLEWVAIPFSKLMFLFMTKTPFPKETAAFAICQPGWAKLCFLELSFLCVSGSALRRFLCEI